MADSWVFDGIVAVFPLNSSATIDCLTDLRRQVLN